MGLRIENDPGRDQLHIVFHDDKFITGGEWCTPNATIAFSGDTPVEIIIHGYYTFRGRRQDQWLFDQNFVEKYHLEEWLDDLRLLYQALFAPPSLGVKTISYEGPDGEEIIVHAGGQ